MNRLDEDNACSDADYPDEAYLWLRDATIALAIVLGLVGAYLLALPDLLRIFQ